MTLSVLYQPFDEMDLTQDYAAPPLQSYFADILNQRQTVEDYVNAPGRDVVIAHSAAELDQHLGAAATTPILIHAIEGGFHIGNDPAEVQGNVRTLAGPRRGLHHGGPPVLPAGGDQRARAALPAATGSTTACFTRTAPRG